MRGAEFAELMAFMAIAEERSFRGAALRLSMSPSALSHSMRSLEQRLGARLLHRTTRSVAPTEAGQALLERLTPSVAEVEDAVRDVGAFQQQPRGLVRINMPRIAAQLIVMPKLAAFRAAYPDIRLELVIDDSITDVIGRGFDFGIRSGSIVQQDMISVPLTPDLRMAVVASPAYFAEWPLPRTPAELNGHACLTYRWYETGALHPWRFDGPKGPVDVIVDSVMTVNDTDLLLDGALRGCGVALLVESLVEKHIADGSLQCVLKDWCKPFSGFHLYYPNRRHMPAAMRTFIDWMKLR
ncbi:LysR family transcriptional regulator [Sphingomonas faeni]|uniref:LysR family transcriptional regulator n=1 Tax=Sphingomonas faeni TaxID=185950 RepID=UPI0024139311|nr:LysR family transcriptional regulator [Sphingomonas faeni]